MVATHNIPPPRLVPLPSGKSLQSGGNSEFYLKRFKQLEFQNNSPTRSHLSRTICLRNSQTRCLLWIGLPRSRTLAVHPILSASSVCIGVKAAPAESERILDRYSGRGIERFKISRGWRVYENNYAFRFVSSLCHPTPGPLQRHRNGET